MTDDTETRIEVSEPSESADDLLFEVTLAADTSSIVPGQTFTMSPTVTNIKDRPLTASVVFEERDQQFGNVPAPSADLSSDDFSVVSHQDDSGEWVEPSSGAGWRWDDLPPGESRDPSVTVLTNSDLPPGEYTFVVHSRGNVPLPYATTRITVEEGPPVELSLEADPSSIRPTESVTLTPTLTNVTDSVVSRPTVYFQSAGSDTAAPADYYGDDFSVESHQETRGDWETEGWSWQRLPGGERRQPSVTVSAAEGIDPGEYTFLAEAFVGGSGGPVADDTATVSIDEPESVGVSVYRSTPQTIPARPQGTNPEFDTGGYKKLNDFATPGWRISSRIYSHQYDQDADKTLQQALHRIDFDSVDYNDQDSYNLEADEFVAPADGRYLLILSVALQIEGVTVAQLNVNGSPEVYDVAEATGGTVIDNESTLTATKVVELETGDTVVPYVSHNNQLAGFPAESETLPDQDVTYLTIEKLS